MPDETPLEAERRAKIARWRAAGREPFPWAFTGRTETATVRAACAALVPGAEAPEPRFRVGGRLKALRQHGKTAFADVEDRSGTIQLILRVDALGEAAYAAWLSDLDPGDLVGAEGTAALSRRGEPSLAVRTLELLAKAIAPPPDKYHGLQDVEERIRRRYVDLLASAEVRERFRLRALLVREIRQYFDEAGFLEVETPVLQQVASGAAAEPFVTRSRYLDAEVQLRISLELPLKRLIVGGLERVYELGRAFRNEDLDVTHAPEFTELEAYWAYADYNDLRRFTEGLFGRLADRTIALAGDSAEIVAAAQRFRPPFATLDFVEALERASGIENLLAKSREELRVLARAAGSTVPDGSSTGTFLDKLFEHFVEPGIDRVTFVVDHPASTTPLAKRHRSKAGRVERFEVFCPGFELANAYTELTDPDEQERRFQEQLGERGDDRYAYDADFVEALRFGMPPTTGIGMGIDRLMMALLGRSSIKDVILFPPVRPR